MAHDYCIWIVTPPGYAHAAAFHEIALGLQGGLRELGLQAPVVQDKRHIRGNEISFRGTFKTDPLLTSE